MIDALGELPARCVLRRKEFPWNSAGTLRVITSTSVPLAKNVRGSHRSDLATVRNCAIARSVAIVFTSTFVNLRTP
jgi:hypothetical protein